MYHKKRFHFLLYTALNRSRELLACNNGERSNPRSSKQTIYILHSPAQTRKACVCECVSSDRESNTPLCTHSASIFFERGGQESKYDRCTSLGGGLSNRFPSSTAIKSISAKLRQRESNLVFDFHYKKKHQKN